MISMLARASCWSTTIIIKEDKKMANNIIAMDSLKKGTVRVYSGMTEDFVEDCASYCDEHYIGTISDETLRNCFEMPATGVKVKHLYFEDCYYPIINSNCFDSETVNHIGHFCTNNGRVVFVYRNGKTYVAKGYKILDELRAAGYTESGLFVPFSNGEQIQDSVLNARWESISK